MGRMLADCRDHCRDPREDPTMLANLERTTDSRIDYRIRVGDVWYPHSFPSPIGFDSPPTDEQRRRVAGEPCQAPSPPQPVTPALPVTQPQPATQLTDNVWNLLPLAGRPADDFDRAEDVIECYCESFAALRAACDESVQFLRTICEVHLRIERSADHNQEQQADYEVARLEECLSIDLPVVDAGDEFRISSDVIPPSAPAAYAKLRDLLQWSTRQFAQSLVGALDQLVDRGVVGPITWDTRVSSWCSLHYFRREIAHDDAGQTIQTQISRPRQDIGVRALWSTETTTTARRTTHEFRHVRIEHQLVDAQRVELGDRRLVVPQEVQPLVARLPDWLAPLVSGVIGEGRGEQRIVLDEQSDMTEEVTVTRTRRMEPNRYFDPALVLGHYVLAGWDETEQQAELARRRQSADRRAAWGAAAEQFLAAIVASLAALVLIVISIRTPGLMPIGIPGWLGLLGLAAFQLRRGLQSVGTIRGVTVSGPLLTAAFATGILNLFGLAVVFREPLLLGLTTLLLGIAVVVRRNLVRT